MNKFELPTNIRQIGSLEGLSMKIYMEDYVCTYLKQYAESGGHTEKIAFLVGKYMIIDGCPHVFVNGVIQGKHSEFADNMECFTEASYDYAQQELDKYFAGSEILGWMQSQPGYGIHLNPSYADYHMNNFTRPYQVLFVMDPIEKLNLFYIWNQEMTGIDEAGGYFVYYDQNKGMQDYMNDNRISRAKVREAAIPKKEMPSTRLKIFEEPEKKASAPKRAPARSRQAMGGVKITDSESADNRLAAKSANRSLEDMRKLSNLLIGLCAVLFITTFIMGAGLLQSDSRIAALENAVVAMDGNYVLMVDQIRTLASLPVFAEHIQPGQADATATPSPEQPPAVTPPPTPAPEAPAIPTPPPQPENETTYDEPIYEYVPFVPTFANLPETYTIQPGDSLIGISRMFYGDIGMVGRIMEINGIVDPDHIVAGQVIYLPSY